jgi:hypothetical protein
LNAGAIGRIVRSLERRNRGLFGTLLRQEVTTMKKQNNDSSGTTCSPFLKLVLTLVERRLQLDKEVSAGERATAPLPAAAIHAAIEEVGNQEPPTRGGAVNPGPFLTMLLMLAEPESVHPRSWLLSSIVPAGSR